MMCRCRALSGSRRTELLSGPCSMHRSSAQRMSHPIRPMFVPSPPCRSISCLRPGSASRRCRFACTRSIGTSSNRFRRAAHRLGRKQASSSSATHVMRAIASSRRASAFFRDAANHVTSCVCYGAETCNVLHPLIVERSRSMAREMPLSQLVVVRGAGHLVSLEQSGEFKRTLTDLPPFIASAAG